MQSYLMPHSNVMEPFFSESKDTIQRGDLPIERRGYNFRERTTKLMGRLMSAFDVSSETRVIEKALELSAKRLPVLDEIHCGTFTDLKPEQISGWKALGDLLPYREGDWLLRARGDAMTGGSIEENDLVLMRPQSTCDSGEVAAVMVKTPTGPRPVLKRVRFTIGSPVVTLSALDNQGAEIVIDTEKETFQICAVKRGIIKAN